MSPRSRTIVKIAGMVSSDADSTKRAMELIDAQSILDDAIVLSSLLSQFTPDDEAMKKKISDIAWRLQLKAIAKSMNTINKIQNIGKLKNKLARFNVSLTNLITKQLKLIDKLKKNSNTIQYSSVASFLDQFKIDELNAMIEYHRLLYCKYRIEDLVNEFSKYFKLPDDCIFFKMLTKINNDMTPLPQSEAANPIQSGGGQTPLKLISDINRVLSPNIDIYVTTSKSIISYIELYMNNDDIVNKNKEVVQEVDVFLKSIISDKPHQVGLLMYKYCIENKKDMDMDMDMDDKYNYDIFDFVHSLIDAELYDQLSLNSREILKVFLDPTDEIIVVNKMLNITFSINDITGH